MSCLPIACKCVKMLFGEKCVKPLYYIMSGDRFKAEISGLCLAVSCFRPYSPSALSEVMTSLLVIELSVRYWRVRSGSVSERGCPKQNSALKSQVENR